MRQANMMTQNKESASSSIKVIRKLGIGANVISVADSLRGATEDTEMHSNGGYLRNHQKFSKRSSLPLSSIFGSPNSIDDRYQSTAVNSIF